MCVPPPRCHPYDFASSAPGASDLARLRIGRSHLHLCLPLSPSPSLCTTYLPTQRHSSRPPFALSISKTVRLPIFRQRSSLQILSIGYRQTAYHTFSSTAPRTRTGALAKKDRVMTGSPVYLPRNAESYVPGVGYTGRRPGSGRAVEVYECRSVARQSGQR